MLQRYETIKELSTILVRFFVIKQYFYGLMGAKNAENAFVRTFLDFVCFIT